MTDRSVAAPQIIDAIELGAGDHALRIRLWLGSGGTWCERQATGPGGTRTLQCLIDDAQQLRRLLAADAWGDRLHPLAERLVRALPAPAAPNPWLPTPLDASGALALTPLAALDEASAQRRTLAVARFLGFDTCALVAASVAADGSVALEVAGPCDPAWAQLYLARDHFRDDTLWHAAASAPGCWLPAAVMRFDGDAQRIVHDTARRHGFAARVAVPAPGPARRRRAVLFLGHGDVRRERLAPAVQGVARELAIEAAQRTLGALGRRELGSVEFSEIETRLLELYDRRIGDREIAACLGEPVALVRARFWRLAAKLKARDRDDALERSYDYGLLTPRSIDLPL